MPACPRLLDGQEVSRENWKDGSKWNNLIANSEQPHYSSIPTLMNS